MDLSSNKLSGQVPTTFPLGIKVLVLSQNEFSHVLPQNLSNFNQLYYLDLRGNNIGGEIPNFLSQMSSLQMLNFRNNSFEGSISINLSSLSALQILDLSCNNNLSGIIPHTLGNLSGMVNHHDFSSSISSSIISQINIFPNTGFLIHAITVANQTVLLLRSLEVFWKKSKRSLPNKNLQLYAFFDLSNNQLSGEIPDSLGGLKNLKSVNLSQNKFFGRIPLSFGDLESLESLDLSHNNLFGEIPYTLANLFELSYLDLSKNKLEGCIPGGP
ncbi:receptor-like protein 46 [Hevea brasiliensis]|uniref:receptor-like protein 46 n=1 Tax=Hevea brasiliensis TaxID=3981 RepID=UPI0025E4F4B6|nr:receptor-like protein 46 [Hevea brasiliensis]XP_058006801.1 receptor-like protein 46 [Hevea brasiliensis]